jgi:hypothetical protein
MYDKLADPELSRQLLENALAATAMSFLALAALVAVLAGIFILGECLCLLTTPPARKSAVKTGGGLQIVYRSESNSPLPICDKIHA